MKQELPVRLVESGVQVTIRLTPRARTERIDGIRNGADGRPALLVSVTAPPAAHQANEALLQLLARALKLPRRELALVIGHKSRDKVVRVSGDPAIVTERLTALIAASE